MAAPTSAPRVPPAPSSMAAASATIQKLKVNGLSPLAGGATDSLHLETAHAMLRFVSAAMQDRDEVNQMPGKSAALDDLNGEQMGLAIDGIATIVALQIFLRDAEGGAA